MTLPFTPTFFKKLDIFQKLIEFDKEVGTKPIWQAEKIALLWAAGKGHKYIGSYVSTKNIIPSLEKEVGKKLNSEESVVFAVYPQKVLDALVVRGFAEKHLNNESVRINQDGLIAGKILAETDFLSKTTKYQVWTYLWWVVLACAFFILINQAMVALGEIIKPIISYVTVLVISSNIFN